MYSRRRKLEVVRRGGRRTLQAQRKRGLPVEVPRAFRRQIGLLPLGSVVEADCFGDDPVRIIALHEAQLPPSVQAASERWRAGQPESALAALDADGALVDDDPCRLAWRVRIELDLEQHAAAARDLRRLLEGGEELDLGEEPPGLINLFSALTPELRHELGPDLAARVPRLDYQSAEVRRLLDMVPLDLWPDAFLSHRVKTGALVGEVERWLGEAQRRALAPAVAVGTARLAELKEREQLRRSVRFKAHPILRKALSSAPREARPAPPPHAGGPPPVLVSVQRTALVRWIVDETKIRADRPEDQEPRVVAGRAVELLAEERGPSAVLHFLLELDQAMMRIELEGQLARLREAPAARSLAARLVEAAPRVLFRGVDGNGRVRAWLVGVGGRRGLFCEVKGTWIWVEGTDDEVIASVPDQWFEGAAAALWPSA